MRDPPDEISELLKRSYSQLRGGGPLIGKKRKEKYKLTRAILNRIYYIHYAKHWKLDTRLMKQCINSK